MPDPAHHPPAERRYGDIETARQQGRLDTVLGVPADDVALLARSRGDGRLDTADVHRLTHLGQHDLIVPANAGGRIDPNHNTGGTSNA